MMGDSTTARSGHRTITAFFDSRAEADRAVERLVAAGVSRSAVSVRGSGTTGSTATSATDDKGFWESLKDLFLPDEDRYTYAEGLRRGGYLVTVSASESEVDNAVDILDSEGTVNIDERAESWRKEGWTGYTAGAGYGSTGAAASTASYGATSAATTSRTTAASGSLREGTDEVIPIVEEQLRVGKRQEVGGRVRIRSYVVETPVQEQVTLRQEHVHVERHAVNRPLTGTEDVFRERVIEAEERSEEAVVSKEARVTEELTIRKDAEQETRTISDTVRRTEVEVEDERGTRVDRDANVTGTRSTR